MCALIESGEVPRPAPLNFVFSETPIDDLLYDASVTQKEDAAVRKVRVARAKCLKRPAASEPGPAGPARKSRQQAAGEIIQPSTSTHLPKQAHNIHPPTLRVSWL